MSRLFLKRSPAGFTLIELLVVIVIIAALAAIIAPGWLTFMNARRANAARDQVLQVLRQAQEQAIRTKRTQVVSFNTTANPPTLTVAAVSGTGVAQSLGNDQYRVGLQVVNGDNNPACPGAKCIVFDDKGNVVNTLPEAGIKLAVSSPINGPKRCVIVQTLLGAMRSASDGDCS